MSYNRDYYLKNREKYLEATKKYLAKKRAEKNKEWLEKQNEYMKEYYLKNPDKRNANKKARLEKTNLAWRNFIMIC